MERERGDRPNLSVPPAIPRPPVALPVDWMALDLEERQEWLGTLGEWVPQIVAEFGLREKVVPRCWFRHPAILHELLALYQYRQQQQYNISMGPPPSAPMDFHYQFGIWRNRMRELVTEAGCTSTQHMAQYLPSWVNLSDAQSAKWQVDFEEYLFDVESASAHQETTKEGAGE